MNAVTLPRSSVEEGKEKAVQVLACIRSGALSDRLHTALQDICASGDGERLRACTREIQRAIEGRC